MDRNFHSLLRTKWDDGKFVCVGLDTKLERIPQLGTIELSMIHFNKSIVDQTCDIVAAYKPNAALYLEQGAAGLSALQESIAYIHRVAPDVPVILDAKVADIGKTNESYAKYAFDYLAADALTVHNYFGMEATQPFLDRAEKGIFVLCRTSNPGSGQFQDLRISNACNVGPRLYEEVAREVIRSWNPNKNCGLVVGATYPDELRTIRQIVDSMPLLIPGIGAQGGDLEKVLHAGLDKNNSGVVISSSSAITGAKDPGKATLDLHQAITRYRDGK